MNIVTDFSELAYLNESGDQTIEISGQRSAIGREHADSK
jgi:hypothetical protein